MNNVRNSPEYLRRHKEIVDKLNRMSRNEVATHVLSYENRIKDLERDSGELRKVVAKYQNIFGRLLNILGASTNQSKNRYERNKKGGASSERGINLPFNYEIAFRNCRVIIADYFEDLKILNPGGSYWNGGKRVAKECAQKLKRMRSV